MSKNNHRAPATLELRSAVLQFSTALAQTTFFLGTLSPREFHRTTTEAGSYAMLKSFSFRPNKKNAWFLLPDRPLLVGVETSD